jgi:hypothetical protein
VYIRRNNLLLSLKAIAAGYVQDPSHPSVAIALVKFYNRLKSKKFGQQSEKVMGVCRKVFLDIFDVDYPNEGISKFVHRYAQLVEDLSSPEHVYAVLRCESILDKKSASYNLLSDELFKAGVTEGLISLVEVRLLEIPPYVALIISSLIKFVVFEKF